MFTTSKYKIRIRSRSKTRNKIDSNYTWRKKEGDMRKGGGVVTCASVFSFIGVALEAFLALAEVSCALDGLINALAVGADAGVPRTVLGLAAGQGALVADGPVQPHRHAALHVLVQVRHLESIVLFNEEGIVTGTPLLAPPVFEGDGVVEAVVVEAAPGGRVRGEGVGVAAEHHEPVSVVGDAVHAERFEVHLSVERADDVITGRVEALVSHRQHHLHRGRRHGQAHDRDPLLEGREHRRAAVVDAGDLEALASCAAGTDAERVRNVDVPASSRAPCRCRLRGCR